MSTPLELLMGAPWRVFRKHKAILYLFMRENYSNPVASFTGRAVRAQAEHTS